MRILLVNMPWHALDYPSIALGILHARIAACEERHEISELYANLRWAEYILEHGEADPNSYIDVADHGFFYGVGEWVFSSALYRQPGHNLEEYCAYLEQHGFDSRAAARLHGLAPAFIEELAQEIVAQGYDLIGFTTTFLQNVPSLSLAQRLRELQPDLRIAFGGGNCDGIQGVTLHRNFPFIDFVVRGEGEQAFVQLLDALGGHGDLAAIEGLCWRDSSGAPVVNRDRTIAYPIGSVPMPIYDTYFEMMDQSPVAGYVEPKLVVESSRGCWWGEKHQCTFCGLNGSMIKFRSKRPDAVFAEIDTLVRKYHALDIVMVDNIMDMGYFKALIPQLIEADWDSRIHYEVKSNLSSAQVKALRDAHVVHVQPGIESLSSRVLRLMKKGVSGVQNVRMLRDGEENNLTVSWNYLYGFPGETDDDYLNIIEQIPALVHLQPPSGATRIALERFSPNFDDPSFGFTRRRPADCYSLIYDLPVSELEDMVYLFETDEAGIRDATARRLQDAVIEWSALYYESSLTYRQVNGVLHISDRRANRAPADIIIEQPRDVAAYLLLRRGMTQAALERALIEEALPIDGLDRWIGDMKRQGLIFEEAGTYLSLATLANPARVRIQPAPATEAAVADMN
ncbi:MAG TPA: RiPP maturation radical SAM C-methyltransferase [Herpetosiphonaceae bacterium]